MDITKTTTDLFSHNLPEFVKGIILLVLTVIIAKIIQLRISYVKASLEKNKSDEKTELNNKIIMLTVGNIIYWLIIIFGILISLKYFGIDVSSLLVVLGTVGLAIGLAMQNTLTEIISGIMILLLNYYDIGDLISIQIGSENIFGKVDQFDLFGTMIKDSDRRVHRVSNTSIVKSHLINYYKNKEVSVGIEVSISNNNTVDINSLLDSLKNTVEVEISEYITDKELISVFISDMSKSGTQIYVRIPVESENFLPARGKARKVIREFCNKNSLLLLDNFYQSNRTTNYYS